MDMDDDRKVEAVMGCRVIGALPQSIAAKVKPGVESAAKKWGVQLPDTLDYGFDLKICRFGNRPIAPLTAAAYNDKLR